MRLIYFGTSSFAVPALERLAESVVLVVAQPARPQGRGMRLQVSPVEARATELGLPVLTPERARNPEFVAHLRSLEADALVVASYGQILSTAVLESARQGGINLHGSILPRYRGAAPIQRSLLNGDPETGITLMQMDKGMDTGDIIAIETLTVLPGETYGGLQDRLAILAAEMAVAWMPRIVSSDYSRTPQDPTLATHAPKVEKAEGHLSIDETATTAFRRYQAFTPAPGVSLGGTKILAASLRPETGEAGSILSVKPELVVAFREGSLELSEVQPEGKKRMAGRDFANGARLQPGMRFPNLTDPKSDA